VWGGGGRGGGGGGGGGGLVCNNSGGPAVKLKASNSLKGPRGCFPPASLPPCPPVGARRPSCRDRARSECASCRHAVPPAILQLQGQALSPGAAWSTGFRPVQRGDRVSAMPAALSRSHFRLWQCSPCSPP